MRRKWFKTKVPLKSTYLATFLKNYMLHFLAVPTSQNVNQMWKMNLSWRHCVQTWHPTSENFANDTFSRQISPLTA